ncbi:TRAP transporter small permease [Kushneria aurantia]|uniref:TRAP transporter small permease protein n=1 Tax=Kushneria aurantia TaxID=504092 RepID=A0ABV6G230_9GAMM|nr:TRAP transporter small permease [Kushneria aurantia]
MAITTAIGRINRQLERLLNVLLLLLLAGFMLLIVYQIVSRNLGFLPQLYWTEEMSRFAFQWMIMLGTAIGVWHGDHFVLEAFPHGSRADRVGRIVRDSSCLLVGVIFITFGFGFALSGFNRIATASQLPMVVTYSTFFVCGVLILSFSMHRLLLTAERGVYAMEETLNTLSEPDEPNTTPCIQGGDPPPTDASQHRETAP